MTRIGICNPPTSTPVYLSQSHRSWNDWERETNDAPQLPTKCHLSLSLGFSSCQAPFCLDNTTPYAPLDDTGFFSLPQLQRRTWVCFIFILRASSLDLEMQRSNGLNRNGA